MGMPRLLGCQRHLRHQRQCSGPGAKPPRPRPCDGSRLRTEHWTGGPQGIRLPSVWRCRALTPLPARPDFMRTAVHSPATSGRDRDSRSSSGPRRAREGWELQPEKAPILTESGAAWPGYTPADRPPGPVASGLLDGRAVARPGRGTGGHRVVEFLVPTSREMARGVLSGYGSRRVPDRTPVSDS